MLAEQAAQNAAKVEEAYGGVAQRASNSSLSSHSFFFSPRFWQLTWIIKKYA